MRINRIEIENYMRLRVVQLTPEGNVVQITGENGSGKSSFLSAIFCALAGKKAVPSQPIRMGETSARITLDLGEVIITRRFSASGETSVIVEAANGARFQRPQQVLESLYGATIDPLVFSRAEPKARLEMLRRLVPLDVDVDALDAANVRDYELRAQWNQRAKSCAERVKMASAQSDPSIDVTPIDTSALLTQMQDAAKHNASIQQHLVTRDTMRQTIARLYSDAGEKRRQADMLLAEATRLEADAAENERLLHDAPPLAEPIDVADLRRQIDEATAANAQRAREARAREELAAATKDLTDAQAESERLTAQREQRMAEKAAAIARATMPVPGLSFGDGEVLFNGVPFDQASTAEQIRVSMAIAMAMNPKLRVVLIRDGSLLDTKSLALVQQMADEHDYQIFIESVRTDGKVGIVLEAGEVVAVDGTPVPDDQQLDALTPAGV